MKRWIATGLVVAAAINLWAQAPEMFRYQGRLVNGTNLVNATLPMSFKLYDSLSGGNKLYEDSSSVLVVDGLYSTMIGDNTVFGSLTNAMTNAAVYLELTVNGETLSPRERLVSVPYAMNAGGNTTPSGNVVLSSTYPNPGLETQGYSVVKTAPGQDWQFVGNWPHDSIYSGPKLSFAGKIWSFWGSSVWNSNDGAKWQCVATNTGFGAGDSVVLFKNKLWTIRNGEGMTYFKEVRYSQDGINWTPATTNAAWSPRSDAALAVFNDKLWLLGGVICNSSDCTLFNDVWCSSDGISWSLVTADAAWVKRQGAFAFAFQNKLWIAGGYFNGVIRNDMWCSTNGIDWVLSSILPHDCTSVCADDDRIYISGNYLSTYDGSYTDYGYCISTSTNGTDWSFCGILNWSVKTSGGEGSPVLLVHNHILWSLGHEIAKLNLIKQDNGLYYYRKD